MTKNIKLNTELPLDLAFGSNAATQAKARRAQEEAACTLEDKTDRVPGWVPVPLDTVDPNSSIAMKLDAKLYPGKMVRKSPKKVVQGLTASSADPNTSAPD